MMTALALGLVVAKEPDGVLPVPTSLAAVERLMASVGYPVVREPKGGATYAVARGRARVWMGVARSSGDPAKGVKDTFPFASLHIEFAVPAGTTWTAVDARDRLGRKGGGPTFEFHLGDTVTETMTLSFRDGATRKGVKAALDRFFEEGRGAARAWRAAYAAAKNPDARRYRFDDGTRLDRPDRISLQRVAKAWGWEDPKTFPYASQSWIFPIRVGGKRLFLRGPVVGDKPVLGSVEVARYDDLPAVGDPWRDRLPGDPVLPTAIYEPDGIHLAVAVRKVQLFPGLPLGDLRREIEAFAREG